MKLSGRIFWDGYGLSNPYSGIFEHAHQIALELKKNDCTPTVIIGEDFSGLWQDCSIIKLRNSMWGGKLFQKYKFSEPLMAYKTLAETLEKNGTFGERHIFHGLSNLNLPWFKKWSDTTKTVLTVHDIIPLLTVTGRNSFYGVQLRIALSDLSKRVDRFVCVSKWTQELFEEEFPQAAGRIVHIPNGTPKYHGKQRSSDVGTLNLLTVSRYEPYKCFEEIIDLVQKLNLEGANAKLTLVTDSTGEQYVREKAASMIVEGYLEVLTSVEIDELNTLYEKSHVYLQASDYEGFCLPAVEALSSGLPVVYKSGSGIDEAVGDQVGIPVAKNATSDEWVEAIIKASKWSMSLAYQEKVEDELNASPSWSDNARKLLEVYSELL